MDWSSVFPALLGAFVVILVERLRQRYLVKKTAAEIGKLDAEVDQIEAETRKTDKETELLIGKYWRELSGEIQKQCEKMVADLALARAEIIDLRRSLDNFRTLTDKNIGVLRNMLSDLWVGVTILTMQLRALDIEPKWKPDDRLKEYCEQSSSPVTGK